MNKYIDDFLKRTFLYRMQYFVAVVVCIIILCLCFGVIFSLKDNGIYTSRYLERFLFLSLFLVAPIYNPVTYFCSKYLADKYGIEMFADLDQNWLKEHQGFDSKAFGEIFARLIQCRKIAGPYMLAVVLPCALINVYFAMIVGIAYLIGYFIYRNTYLDTAIADKLPRAFGGGGVIISKILDKDEKNDK